MERNTVNIDLEDYNALLIKAEKYDEIKRKGYTPDHVIPKERPVVNIKIKNEADIPAIKSFIEEENAKNVDFKLM
ncbi:dCMP hydroxymethylase [Staphylococcus phage EW]|uniref:ORF074 n=1 Tax=Staphylococcus phage EW TaxID=2936814 RepID=Q4ZC71_9CAUD|nr:dCMP hydroxymethylase [Staphylococcus phage EW]AAX91395.1 ORF074 [Staphylococcus phage EW]